MKSTSRTPALALVGYFLVLPPNGPFGKAFVHCGMDRAQSGENTAA
jgi:hypothetical protein